MSEGEGVWSPAHRWHGAGRPRRYQDRWRALAEASNFDPAGAGPPPWWRRLASRISSAVGRMLG